LTVTVIGRDDEIERCGGSGGGGGGFHDGFSGVVERFDGNTLVATSEWISRVDIRIARDAKSSGVSFARDGSWCLFAHFTHPNTLVAGREFVSGMNSGIAVDT
jgi:hypothetical protein